MMLKLRGAHLFVEMPPRNLCTTVQETLLLSHGKQPRTLEKNVLVPAAYPAESKG